MTEYIGDFTPGATIRSMWNSNDSNGASITRATDGAIVVSKNGSTTLSTAGITDTENFAGLTGTHLVSITTTSDGTFYATGADFIVLLSSATIDTQVVNAALFSFSLENRTPLRPTTAGQTLDVSAAGNAGIDWANVAGSTSTLALTGTSINAVSSEVAKLGTTAKAEVNAEVLDVLSVDTFAEPTGAPAATATISSKVGYLAMALRNKITVTSTSKTFFDDGGAAEWSKVLTDDGTTYTEAEGT
jgi:hypothetical protein